MATPDCQICYCPIEGAVYSCADPKCADALCRECLQSYIKFSANNMTIPKCPNQNCNAYFILATLKGIPPESIAQYKQACLDFMLKDQGTVVQKQLEEEKILEQLRAERAKFIQLNFPKAIALVASWTFTSKLRQLEKQRSRVVSSQLKAASRTCMNTSCKGFLDKNMVCMTCMSEFCKMCETTLKPGGHQCNQADLDSVNVVNSLVRCPGCKLPVFKNEGCNNITCSNCGTKFQYTTGQEGGSGSHNAKIHVNLTERKKMSAAYDFKGPALELMLKIEAAEPAVKSKEILLTPIKYLYQTQDKEGAADLLAKQFSILIRNKYENRDYQRLLVDIEDFIKTKPDEAILQAYLENVLKTRIHGEAPTLAPTPIANAKKKTPVQKKFKKVVEKN